MSKKFLIILILVLVVIFIVGKIGLPTGTRIDDDPQCTRVVIGHEGNNEIVRIECK